MQREGSAVLYVYTENKNREFVAYAYTRDSKTLRRNSPLLVCGGVQHRQDSGGDSLVEHDAYGATYVREARI